MFLSHCLLLNFTVQLFPDSRAETTYNLTPLTNSAEDDNMITGITELEHNALTGREVTEFRHFNSNQGPNSLVSGPGCCLVDLDVEKHSGPQPQRLYPRGLLLGHGSARLVNSTPDAHL